MKTNRKFEYQRNSEDEYVEIEVDNIDYVKYVTLFVCGISAFIIGIRIIFNF
jgi:isopentenyldiphosphate isomerase